MDIFFQEAIKEAKKGLEEGGIPIGSVIVYKDKIIGRGHNQRVHHLVQCVLAQFYFTKSLKL